MLQASFQALILEFSHCITNLFIPLFLALFLLSIFTQTSSPLEGTLVQPLCWSRLQATIQVSPLVYSHSCRVGLYRYRLSGLFLPIGYIVYSFLAPILSDRVKAQPTHQALRNSDKYFKVVCCLGILPASSTVVAALAQGPWHQVGKRKLR